MGCGSSSQPEDKTPQAKPEQTKPEPKGKAPPKSGPEPKAQAQEPSSAPPPATKTQVKPTSIEVQPKDLKTFKESGYKEPAPEQKTPPSTNPHSHISHHSLSPPPQGSYTSLMKSPEHSEHHIEHKKEEDEDEWSLRGYKRVKEPPPSDEQEKKEDKAEEEDKGIYQHSDESIHDSQHDVSKERRKTMKRRNTMFVESCSDVMDDELAALDKVEEGEANKPADDGNKDDTNNANNVNNSNIDLRKTSHKPAPGRYLCLYL